MHHRFAPKTHRFDYRIFLFAIDLDELPDWHRKLALFSANRRNLYSFREEDYLPTGEGSLKDRVLAFLRQRGVGLEGGRVVLVTLPRVFGYLFNPVSFYFCFDRAGAPVAALAEVTNTFREMKTYFLGPETRGPGRFLPSADPEILLCLALLRRRRGIRFHPAHSGRGAGNIHIDDYVGNVRTPDRARWPDRGASLTDARLAGWTFLYPLITLRIVALIHWHALRLWLKRVPWFAKSGRPGDQRDVRRPHSTLTPARSHDAA